MSANRHLGRIIALQTLYEYGFRIDCGDKTASLDDVLERNIDRYDDVVEDTDFIKRLVEGTNNESQKLDQLLQPIAPEWPMEQIARMDRVVLHIAAYELTHKESTPPKVVINEAVELAKAFGGDNSSKFVNGVLGTLYSQQEDEKKVSKK